MSARPPAPLVSILTPSYNQAEWLPDNLASVAAQDYRQIEHIVMDGGSTDGSLDVLSERSTDSRLRWRSEPDSGQSDAINKAFSASSGEIIGWLNSDDAYFRRDAVSLAVEMFRTNPEADVVFGHAALVNADGRILQVIWVPSSAGRLMRLHNFICQPAVFIRRAALGNQMVDPSFEFMMDWELWLRLASQHRFTRINHILAIDRHQSGRKVVTRPDLEARDWPTLRAAHRPYTSLLARGLRKALKVSFRGAGLAKVPEALEPNRAFAGHGDWRLALRQIAVPRARMPFDG